MTSKHVFIVFVLCFACLFCISVLLTLIQRVRAGYIPACRESHDICGWHDFPEPEINSVTAELVQFFDKRKA